jgi:hypothetical protein
MYTIDIIYIKRSYVYIFTNSWAGKERQTNRQMGKWELNLLLLLAC